MKKICLLVVFVLFFLVSCDNGNMTLYIESMSYAEYQEYSTTAINEGDYACKTLTNSQFKAIDFSAALKYSPSDEELKDWFIDRGLDEEKATSCFNYLKSEKHAMVVFRTGSVYLVVK